MRRTAVLGAGLLALLGLAVLWARHLASDVEAPPAALSEVHAPGPAETPPPRALPPGSPRPARPAPETTPVTPATGVAGPTTMPPPPPPGAPADAPVQEWPQADNPFTGGRSTELAYAWKLVHGPDAGVESARSAAEVFERCLKQFPDNRDCYSGLVAAQAAASGQPLPAPSPVSLPPVRDLVRTRQELPSPKVERFRPGFGPPPEVR